MTIPDLRQDSNEVTIEHCSVLLERMAGTLHTIYEGDPEEFRIICDAIDPVGMRSDLLGIMTPKAFNQLFESEFGKGILVGAFVQKFVFKEEEN